MREELGVDNDFQLDAARLFGLIRHEREVTMLDMAAAGHVYAFVCTVADIFAYR